jgi:prepilin-type N-terminal cleavage/methylation domain-containing protein
MYAKSTPPRYKKYIKEKSGKRRGFTLAEVLVTLAIIGVVSAITIPTLVTSVQHSQYEAALKKDFSVVANAYKLLDADGVTMEAAFPATDTDMGSAALNMIAPKLNIIKNCGSGMGCWYDSSMLHLDGSVNIPNFDTTVNGGYGKAILADGTMLLIFDNFSKCTEPDGPGPLVNTCGWIFLDVNGAKGPNTCGRDVFMFWVTKTGLYPFGSDGDGYSNDCNTNTNSFGFSCTYTVLTQGMNY